MGFRNCFVRSCHRRLDEETSATFVGEEVPESDVVPPQRLSGEEWAPHGDSPDRCEGDRNVLRRLAPPPEGRGPYHADRLVEDKEAAGVERNPHHAHVHGRLTFSIASGPPDQGPRVSTGHGGGDHRRRLVGPRPRASATETGGFLRRSLLFASPRLDSRRGGGLS